MKAEAKRVKKVAAPLLVIGLDGTGSDSLLTIKDKFRKHFVLPRTENFRIHRSARPILSSTRIRWRCVSARAVVFSFTERLVAQQDINQVIQVAIQKTTELLSY